jgi:acetyltransferase-like isoleucine patch superfamily enzyme
MNFLRSFFRQIISIIRYPKLFLFSKRTGKQNRLGPNGRFLHPEEISLGDNIYIAPGFHISARNLSIGNNVLIGPNLLLECDDHNFKNIGKTIWSTMNERIIGFVTIEDDVWIGGNVTILKNVNIGEGAVIGAGSVVTRSIPPYSICVGTPCRPVKVRFNTEELRAHLSIVKSHHNINTIVDQWVKYGLI